MKFLKEHQDFLLEFNIDFELIELAMNEGRVGDWIIHAPKIRNIQKKANAMRLKAAHAEAEQRKSIEKAREMGKDPDLGRMWTLLQQKLDAWEDTAREYEAEAMELTSGNQYLQKVQRVTRLKGALKVNAEKIAVATSEERRELTRRNKEYDNIIRTETRVINDKIKADETVIAARDKKEKAAVAAKKNLTPLERNIAKRNTVKYRAKYPVKYPPAQKHKNLAKSQTDSYLAAKRAQSMRDRGRILGPGGKDLR